MASHGVLAAFSALALFPAACMAQDDATDGATAPTKLSTQAAASVAGINEFSLDLYRRTASAKENHFISPASVSLAMGLAYRGAGGATADELRRTMRYAAVPRDYLRDNGELLASMNFKRDGRELATANAIWIDPQVALRPDYQSDVEKYAKAGIQRTDFAHAPEPARQAINRWVETATRDRIKNMLQPGDITSVTRSVLVNAVYWKGAWEKQFNPNATKPEPFTRLDGSREDTPLMNQAGRFQGLERDGVKAILLPYVGGEAEMAVLPPDAADGLPGFEAGLTAKALDRWLGDLQTAPARPTVLALPKIRLEKRAELVPALRAMGATTPFTDSADFSGMMKPGGPPFTISKVIHQTYLNVDEEGSEAAAATAVIMRAGSAVRPEPPFVFRADKPFLFLLRDRRTGLILFIGRYVGPES
jgi:serpin B